MKNNKLLESINRLGIFIGGGVSYHVVDRALSYHDTLLRLRREEQKQDIRDDKFNEAIEEAKTFYSHALDQFKILREAVEAKTNNTVTSGGDSVNSVVISKDEWVKTANNIKSHSNSVMSKLSEFKLPNWENTDAYKNLNKIVEEVENFANILQNDDKTNKFVSGSSRFYDYLDSLTLLQESSLLHIIMFLVLLITVINILGVLFGNEIIKYLKLEERFPKLAIFFKLRSQFQRYYLMWNVSILFIVCIVGIGIDLLLFCVK